MRVCNGVVERHEVVGVALAHQFGQPENRMGVRGPSGLVERLAPRCALTRNVVVHLIEATARSMFAALGRKVGVEFEAANRHCVSSESRRFEL